MDRRCRRYPRRKKSSRQWASRLTPLLLSGLAALSLAACGLISGGRATVSTPLPTSPYARYLPSEQSAVAAAIAKVRVALPKKPGAPAPVLPSDAFGRGLGSKEVIGFLPSWEMADVSSVDYAALSEICYYAAQVGAGGTIEQTGQGWEDLTDGAAATLVSDAHQSGVRALLSLFTETQSTLAGLAKKPASDGEQLADEVAPLLEEYRFDGVDLDLEGDETSARHGFVGFIASFSRRLRQIDPSWTIVLNTFPQSAVDETSFFDVRALAPYVDSFFVMAYDMDDPSVPSATAPLTGANLTDASALASYATSVPPEKVILGIPFYGYDFTATRRKDPADTIGGPEAVTYSSIVSTGRGAIWDPETETPYLSFRRGGHWHQTWFDDPTSVALKVALADAFGVGGVGAWELGMAVNSPQMATSLDGGSPPARLALASQP